MNQLLNCATIENTFSYKSDKITAVLLLLLHLRNTMHKMMQLFVLIIGLTSSSLSAPDMYAALAEMNHLLKKAFEEGRDIRHR